MTKIIFATGNKDKMREIREIMQDCDVEIISMKDISKADSIARVLFQEYAGILICA